MAFTVLIALLMGIGYLGLSRMNQINTDLSDVLGRHWHQSALVPRGTRILEPQQSYHDGTFPCQG